MTTTWPHHLAHREAVCVFCASSLRNLSPTNNAPGQGHYRGECSGSCKLHTWYDCAEGTVELIQQNERTPCPDCAHPWSKHRRQPNGSQACEHFGCGCRDVVEPLPAAACPRCGGWTSYGGMSQHSEAIEPVHGRPGCTCRC